MNEETAIFIEGKRLSALRNSGSDLSDKRIKVGNSMVLPDELADEYDKHFPPGPRQVKQATQKKFQYQINTDDVRDYRGELLGIKIYDQDQGYDFLKDLQLTRLGTLEVTSSTCNQFDHVQGSNATIVIDKINLQISIIWASYHSDHTHWIEEQPILGDIDQSIDLIDRSSTIRIRFPFVHFRDFTSLWETYTCRRIKQVQKMQRFDWENIRKNEH